MLKFDAYRLNLLTQADNLFTGSDPRSKEEKFHDVLALLIKASKDDFKYKNSRYILFYNDELLEKVYLFQFAREEKQDIPVEGKTSIETQPVLQTPSVYLIIDVQKQIVLIQEKKIVFQDVEACIRRLEYYLTIKLKDSYITPSLSPILDRNEFWDIVKSAQEITEFDLTLNSPNLFKGRQKAEELVEELHEEFNATQFTIKLKNALGKLKLDAETVGNYVAFAAAGAGSYILKLVQNGKKRILKSYELVIKKNYTEDSPQAIDKTKLNDDLEELDKLNENP